MGNKALEAETTYTLYFMQLTANGVARITHVEAHDDEQATQIAATWPWAGPVEIWNGDRMIGRLEPDDAPWAA